MKLATFNGGSVGRIDGDTVVQFDVASTREYFERGGDVGETGWRAPLAEVRLNAPIAPKKLFHAAGTYHDHIDEAVENRWAPTTSGWIMFFQNVDAIVGPDDAVLHPEHLTDELDYEVELAVIIGQSGSSFGPDEAASYIAGYTVHNDITARNLQRYEMERGTLCMAKCIETFSPLGPWIVTPDEFDPADGVALELRVNGEVRQRGTTGDMTVSIPELVAHYSAMRYSAGDVMTTGTVSGVAMFSEDPHANYLRAGDVVEAEVEGIGVLRNTIRSASLG